MHRRGNDPAEAERDCTGQDGRRHVPLFNDLFPKIERRELRKKCECRHKYGDAEGGKNQCIEEWDVGQTLTVEDRAQPGKRW